MKEQAAQRPFTWADLKTEIDKLSPDQLAMPVRWTGEERAGTVKCIEILTEDHVNPGEYAEPVSVVRKALIEVDGLTEEDADKEIGEYRIVGRTGEVYLVVD